jgi:hypothetical protein
VIAVNAGGDGYPQHYFDSRGIVRVYAMSLVYGVWTLVRDRPDSTPLSFSQRYVGRFSDDGRTIRGAWERSADGGEYRRPVQRVAFARGHSPTDDFLPIRWSSFA